MAKRSHRRNLIDELSVPCEERFVEDNPTGRTLEDGPYKGTRQQRRLRFYPYTNLHVRLFSSMDILIDFPFQSVSGHQHRGGEAGCVLFYH